MANYLVLQLKLIFQRKSSEKWKSTPIEQWTPNAEWIFLSNFMCTCGSLRAPIEHRLNPETQIIYLITLRWSYCYADRAIICSEMDAIVCSTFDLLHKIHFSIWRTPHTAQHEPPKKETKKSGTIAATKWKTRTYSTHSLSLIRSSNTNEFAWSERGGGGRFWDWRASEPRKMLLSITSSASHVHLCGVPLPITCVAGCCHRNCLMYSDSLFLRPVKLHVVHNISATSIYRASEFMVVNATGTLGTVNWRL